jgi:hypothetical protein
MTRDDGECPDCGRPRSDALVLGFFCEHPRCPLCACGERSAAVPDEPHAEAFARSLAFQDACDNGGEEDA